MRISILVLVASLLIGLIGCDKSSDIVKGDSLDGTYWRLKAWSVDSLNPADFTITANFADGQVSGSSGVNSYGGPYNAGPGTAFSAGSLASTMMGGSEAAMRAESVYLMLLGQAVSYRISDGRLTLYDAAGLESLIFDAAISAANTTGI
ncbi:MAG: META domain-containing protein [bacterium]